MNQEKIGKFIAELRKNKNLTQKEFADKLRVSDKTVSRWETGHYLPDISLFNDICSILDIDVNELLKGEKVIKNIDSKEVDKTLTNLVSISNKKIKDNKKKSIIISSIIVLIITFIFISFIIFNKNSNYIVLVPQSQTTLPTRYAVIEKDDGWFCHFEIEYLIGDLSKPNYYGYSCDNFKYSSLSNYEASGSESDDKGIFEYKIEVNHPSYIYNKNYSNDIRKMSNYFISKGYNEEISLSDLDDLDLIYIDKNEVINLYNKAINSDLISKYGNYPNTYKNPYVVTSSTKDDYTWKFGYYLVKGHIKYVNIELLIKDDYLSDLVKNNKATKEQLEIYNNITKIKNYIIEKQVFEIPADLSERPYSFLKEILLEIEG